MSNFMTLRFVTTSRQQRRLRRLHRKMYEAVSGFRGRLVNDEETFAAVQAAVRAVDRRYEHLRS